MVSPRNIQVYQHYFTGVWGLHKTPHKYDIWKVDRGNQRFPVFTYSVPRSIAQVTGLLHFGTDIDKHLSLRVHLGTSLASTASDETLGLSPVMCTYRFFIMEILKIIPPWQLE